MVSTFFICLDCFLIVMYFIFRISKALRQKMNNSMAGFIGCFLLALLVGSIAGMAYYFLGAYIQAHGFEMYSIIGFTYHFAPLFLIAPLSRLYKEMR